jgi:hypothetical protein
LLPEEKKTKTKRTQDRSNRSFKRDHRNPRRKRKRRQPLAVTRHLKARSHYQAVLLHLLRDSNLYFLT